MATECVLNHAEICKLGKCIRGVQGLPSNSSSPSDTWLLDFKSGTRYENSDGKFIDIPNAFCKVFIEPSSLEKWLEKANVSMELANSWKGRYLTLQGLEYELHFSEFVQREIIDAKKSPHFVRTFSTGKSCKFQDLQETLEKGGISYPAASLSRNMYYSIQVHPTRPSISTPTIPEWPDWNNFRFSFLLNQQIDNQSKTFHQWMHHNRDKHEFLPNLFAVLFQICQACYALYLERACHNDLHSNNIWITHRPGVKTNVSYTVGSKTYIFPETDHLVRLFDFDRSYAESLGPNPVLDSEVCANYGSCNAAVEPKDFVKVLCYVVGAMKTPLQQQIVRSILIDEKRNTQSVMIFNMIERAQCFSSEEIMSDENFSEFPSYQFMLEKIYNMWRHYSRKITIFENIHIDESFVLNPSPEEKKSPEEDEKDEEDEEEIETPRSEYERSDTPLLSPAMFEKETPSPKGSGKAELVPGSRFGISNIPRSSSLKNVPF